MSVPPDLTVSVRQSLLPPHDPSHGTPVAMRLREFTFRLGGASARFEQTDYGHPGRWNPPDPRGMDLQLQPKAEELRAAALALGGVLD